MTWKKLYNGSFSWVVSFIIFDRISVLLAFWCVVEGIKKTRSKIFEGFISTNWKLVRQVVFCSGFTSAFGGLLPLSVQGHFVYCWQRVNVLLGAIGFLVLLYIAAFTHGRRIIAHFLPMAIYKHHQKKKHRLYAFLACCRWYTKVVLTLAVRYEQIGSWYVCVSYLYIYLVRFGLRAPDPDPSILPFEE